MRRSPIAVLPAAAALVVLLVAPCPAPAAGLGWYRELVAKPNAEFSDAVRILHVLMTGEDGAELSFEDRLVYLVKRGVVDLEWDLDAGARFDCGQLAFMLCKAMRIRGGVSMRVFGLSERYAYRECVDLDLVAPLGQEQFVSGEELLSVLRRARAFQKTRGRDIFEFFAG